MFKVIKELKPSYSKGLNGIPMINLKYAASVLAPPLKTIINQSIKQHKYPDRWKHGVLIPIHKKSSPTEKKRIIE